MNEFDLPPLPGYDGRIDGQWGAFHLGTMQAYARAAIEADRKRRGEPIKLIHMAVIDEGDLRMMSGRRAVDCELYAMPDFGRAPVLYTAPQPAEPCVAPTSDKPASGAQNVDQAPQITDLNINYKQLYEQMCDRCGYLDEELAKYTERAVASAVKESLMTAEPVKVPSDIELDDLADDFHGYAGNYTRHGYPIPKFNHVGYARALLARYGQPTEPVKGVSDAPAALRFAAQVVELYDDATMGNDYMIDSRDCAGILSALADYFSRFNTTPPADGQTQQESIHLPQLRHAIADITELRQQIELMKDQLGGNVWIWEPEGENHLESMGNRMGVLIYACDLKALLAQAQQDAACVAPVSDKPVSGAQNAFHATQPQQVPKGYKLVPIEPTEEMLNAARDWSDKKYGKPIGNDAAVGCFQAMLEASPEVKP